MEFLNRMRARRGERRLEHWLATRGCCFVQGDQVIANQAGAAYRSDNNNELQALVTLSSGATAPATTYAHQLWADTTANALKKRNAANSGWIVVRTLDESFVLSRSANTILGVSDVGKTIVATPPFTQTLTAAATLGDGWWVSYRVETGGTLTFDPNGAENIDGATTKAVVGPSSGLVFCNGTAFFTVGFAAAATVSLPRSYLAGYGLANNGADAVNDIDIAVGTARDSTNAYDITLGSAITKRLDAAWAVGTNQGGLDTGSIGNGTYHLWAIRRSDTGVVDVLFSLSATAPTMPTSYDAKRCIGSILRESATIIPFTQDGDYFRRSAAVLDVNVTNPGTAAVTRTVSVPTGRNVHAIVNLAGARGTAVVPAYLLSDLASTDVAPSLTAQPLFSWATSSGFSVSEVLGAGPFLIRTNTSAQIRSRLSASAADTSLLIATLGWWDARGKND